MGLRGSYTLIAPLYDAFVERATVGPRQRSLARLVAWAPATVLLPGVGSGLDLPLLPAGPRYVGLDLTPAMLERARRRARALDLAIELHEGDATELPFPDAHFDAVVLHLILAVVPRPERLLAETARVLRPGGRALILDKFLRPGQRAPLRRLLSPLLGRFATRTDVVLEALLPHAPALAVEENSPALAGGWFRHVVLVKETLNHSCARNGVLPREDR